MQYRFQMCNSMSHGHHSASHRNHLRLDIAKRTAGWHIGSYLPFADRGIAVVHGLDSRNQCSDPMATESILSMSGG